MTAAGPAGRVPPGTRRCAECGAPGRPRSCGDLFGGLLALDHPRQPPWGPLHGVAVACFGVQHPSRSPSAARHLHWAMLHAYLRGGIPAVASMTERARRLNARQRGGRDPVPAGFPGAPPFPAGAPPSGYATTIAGVALDGSFPAAG